MGLRNWICDPAAVAAVPYWKELLLGLVDSRAATLGKSFLHSGGVVSGVVVRAVADRVRPAVAPRRRAAGACARGRTGDGPIERRPVSRTGTALPRVSPRP